MRTQRASLIGSIFLLGACGPSSRVPGDGIDGGGDDDSDGGSSPFGDASAADGCQKIDLLFVIDNSGSMQQEQDNLAANFPGFISVIEASGLDYRVGVTTSGRDYEYTMTTPIGSIGMDQDGGDNGRLLQSSACGMTRPWIEQSDPDPSAAFACIANVGVDGPSDEMPLGAVRDAFEERIADGSNVGFVRPDALLAVVLLTDENDCSYEQSVSLPLGQDLCDSQLEPVSNYVTFLDGFAGGRAKWATAVIAGATDCESDLGNADEATRLIEFVAQTGTNAALSSICEGDLAVSLADALALFDSACDDFPIE